MSVSAIEVADAAALGNVTVTSTGCTLLEFTNTALIDPLAEMTPYAVNDVGFAGFLSNRRRRGR